MENEKRLSPEEERQIDQRIRLIVIAAAAGILIWIIWCAVTKREIGRGFNILVSVFVILFWLLSDVVSMKLKHGFAGRTEAQKSAYYKCAALDAVAYAGIVYFLVGRDQTSSLIGAMIYFVGIMNARKFRQEYYKEASEEETSENGQDQTEGSLDSGAAGSADKSEKKSADLDDLPSAADREQRLSTAQRVAMLNEMAADAEEPEDIQQ